MAASSTSSQEEYEYDVFLSFRGEDTRRGFIGHLNEALRKWNIRTFMDDINAETGYQISPQLRKAIMGSKIWIIVCSKDFASSTWCLDEVVQILERNRNRNREGNVIPIFYGIKPTIVRKQDESFAEAFAKHAERFKDRIGMVQQWRDALNEVSGVTGYDSQDFRYDHELINKIVNDVLSKLPKDQLTIDHFKKNLIGIEEPIKEIESLLCIDSEEDVCIIGIWGMGGIGKTTLGSTVFAIYKSSFDAACILKNIREESGRHGKEHLRKKLLSDLLNDESILKKDTPSVMSTFIEKRFGRKKVIVLLDDLDEISSLQYFLEGHEQFAAGSRIIVTTRDVQLLRPVTDKIYKVKGLDDSKALKLFHKHAFGRQISFAADYKALSERVVNYANGNPLALMVLGSSLHSTSIKQWESVLNKQKVDPNKEILQVLKISYDRLSKSTKNMFLDIACFTIGEVDREEVENTFSCIDDYDVTIEIDALIDKSLIRESYNRWFDKKRLLSMHDLLREMGQAIVCEESNIPGNRSRLWTAKDVCHVLEKNKGTDTIQGISLNLRDINKNVRVSPTAFSNMCHLKYLKIYGPLCEYNIYAPEGLLDISDELRYFRWDSCPLKYLPNFSRENLVQLIVRASRLEKLWNEVQLLDLVKLKKIDLGYSKHLTEIPNLSGAINLEVINLEGCKSLVQVHLNFQNHHKLKFLYLRHCHNLEECRDSENIATNTAFIEEEPSSSVKVGLDFSNCKRLRCIPESIGKLKNLESLRLSECPNLEKFPEISSEGMECLCHLSLEETAIEELPESIGNIKKLETLSLRGCKRLKSLPQGIGKLKYLKSLHLIECPNLEKFPEISSEGMECLLDLWLEGTAIEELPESIGNIKNLETLSLRGCKRLKSLPQGIRKLEYMRNLIVSDCPNLEGQYLPEIWDVMKVLYAIELDQTGIQELPESIEKLTGLRTLNLGGCRQIKFLPNSLCKLSNLKWLNLKECSSLEELPRLPLDLDNLNIKYCESLKSIQQLPSSVTYFDAAGCTSLKTIRWEDTEGLPDYCKKVFWRFENCLDLDQSTLNNIIANTDYLSLNDPDLAHHVLFYGHDHLDLDIVYRGDEIPEWFNYANDDGNSINIQLPVNWFKESSWFVICIVGVLNNFDDDDQSVDYGYFDDDDDGYYFRYFDDNGCHHHNLWSNERRRSVSLKYEFNFKTKTSNGDDGLYKHDGSYETTIANTDNADHVFIMHDENMYLGESELEQEFGSEWSSICCNYTLQASFSVNGEDIKKCGIRFINPETENDDVDETNVDSTIGECSDQATGCQDTDEPHPQISSKRIKLMGQYIDISLPNESMKKNDLLE